MRLDDRPTKLNLASASPEANRGYQPDEQHERCSRLWNRTATPSTSIASEVRYADVNDKRLNAETITILYGDVKKRAWIVYLFSKVDTIKVRRIVTGRVGVGDNYGIV